MSNTVLNSLLREYEQKKLKAELDLEDRKNKIYSLLPILKDIDDELNSICIQITKNILSNPENKSDLLANLNKKIESLKDAKESILKKNNYSLDYFTPDYECKFCNDTGYCSDSNSNTYMCSCLKQKLLDISFNKSNMYGLKKENFDSFNELIFSDKADVKKYKSNKSPRENILDIKQKCMDFVNNFDNPNYKNLFFTGSTGLR